MTITGSPIALKAGDVVRPSVLCNQARTVLNTNSTFREALRLA